MPKRSSKKKPADLNQLAKAIVDQATSEDSPEDPPELTENGKNAAAVSLGRLGGKKGGPARAAKLSKARRKEIAQQAAKARWAKNSQDTH